MKGIFLCVFSVAAFWQVAFSTPLDDYVNKPDDSYAWELANTVQFDDYNLYILNLTSQTWLSDREIDKPLWQHWVRIIVPNNNINSRFAGIYCEGGSNPLGSPPNSASDYLVPVALRTGVIVAELNQIPNQPIIFADEDFGRGEDSFLAKTWDNFISSRNPEDLGRLPMVKAVVKAMDAMQEFLAEVEGSRVPEEFFIAGGSKRGWATWLAGAVDDRVNFVAPIVIDVLELSDNINEIYRTLGRFPVAFKDYVEQNITRCLNCPAFREIADIEDPKMYLDRFERKNVPIFAVNAVGDEFFIPIGWKFWYQEYPGEKHLRYLPNAEHSMATAILRIQDSLASFIHMTEYGIQRPSWSWSINEAGNVITIEASQIPARVELFQAYNRFSRSFILNCYLTCLWRGTEIEPKEFQKENSDEIMYIYEAAVEIPEEGFTGFMVELAFDVGADADFVESTGVSIVPDVFEHDFCPDEVCGACETCRGDNGEP